ncbi:flagellar basal-body rod protein FlgG [Gluconobacter wancherniae]|uniref:Flagellar basal-body rod protein FlgG n=1 Tax=Gluconobacter wancherniae NBRC 103581 TaxID=656744 RepID=A0A511B4S2_9PROT|nr:flagellar basal-body rod protein FlgG [Gluconobacter wancherniae]MBF0854691.1 flagellar basal-body rod protein FlgG [Gluconobacter wancherniae]MBS1063774.1 flagellar basal-body rod protein FlgG [Gluconobacter wancherniae]MBS1089532.1 flagellar basal-body rod protein FlgG [Gluconobacter wancherniae]MBS1095305.1 flagellar basal-body rod protein FlgG [Gluconobacter wancherniae]GBD57579.1 flagellar basal-body rod protein FlgG [Gluconobacter wancherniae NBRC 103581]
MRALDIAGTGMQAQQNNVETISNNIANMSTTGYKRSRAEFQDLIYQNMRRVGTASSDTGTIVPAGAQIGLGVKTAAIYRINEQGTLEQTSNTLDFAVQGRGYFQVQLPSGQLAYTRDGTFSMANDGSLVTADGYQISPTITIPNNAQSVSVDQSGQVSVTIAGQNTSQIVGQLQLAIFTNENGLAAMGQNLFTQTQASGDAMIGTPNTTGYGSTMQGYVENSNVNVVTEITDLITAQRAYEMNSKVITSADEMMQTLTNLGR